MDLLILFRHAKAAPASANDRARPLSATGRIGARDAGAALAARGLCADRVLISPSARTRETWALAGPALGDPPSAIHDALYMAGVDEIWREALAANAARVMIVGHNPGLHDLAVLLLARSHDRSPPARALMENLTPGAWAAFHIFGARLSDAGATLADSWSPK